MSKTKVKNDAKNEAQMQIVYLPPEELKFADYNPRQLSSHDHAELKKSLKKYGFAVPIVVNQHEDRYNVIIGGHQRVRVAKELGFESIPCSIEYHDLESEKELNIRLNRNGGEFDDDALANYFDKEELLEFGFKEQELGMYMDDFSEEFYSYDDSNAEMPIVAKFSEKYDALVIVCKNEIDLTFLQTALNIQGTQSYKNSHTGKGMVIDVEQFRKAWESK